MEWLVQEAGGISEWEKLRKGKAAAARDPTRCQHKVNEIFMEHAKASGAI
jgi:hypothetical protein